MFVIFYQFFLVYIVCISTKHKNRIFAIFSIDLGFINTL